MTFQASRAMQQTERTEGLRAAPRMSHCPRLIEARSGTSSGHLLNGRHVFIVTGILCIFIC
eukprot:6183756-Pleurochrysis_carterae.AAC.2